jgi:hypothetical protein
LTEDKSIKIEVFPKYTFDFEKLQEIIEEMEAMILEYKEYQEYEKIYAKFLKVSRAHQHEENEEFAHYFKQEELALLEKYNYAPITPNPFPHGYPCFALVYPYMEHVSEKRIFSPRIKGKASKLRFLNHRHTSLSIIISTQIFKKYPTPFVVAIFLCIGFFQQKANNYKR